MKHRPGGMLRSGRRGTVNVRESAPQGITLFVERQSDYRKLEAPAHRKAKKAVSAAQSYTLKPRFNGAERFELSQTKTSAATRRITRRRVARYTAVSCTLVRSPAVGLPYGT